MQENLIFGTKMMGSGMVIVVLVLAILYVIIKFMGKMANK